MSKLLKLITANAFWIVVVINMFMAMQAMKYPEGSFSYNRTIGVSWDMTKVLWWIFMWIPMLIESLPIYAVGYGIVKFSKRAITVRLTIIHLLLILIGLALQTQNFYFHKLVSITCWIVFMIGLTNCESIED